MFDMIIEALQQEFSVCKVKDLSEVNMKDDFYFVGKTDEENSLVCSSQYVPANAEDCDSGWRAFRIQGTLDFSLTGILSRISGLLAENKIGIFAVSTYNTDYILIKNGNFQKALAVLEDSGYEIRFL